MIETEDFYCTLQN